MATVISGGEHVAGLTDARNVLMDSGVLYLICGEWLESVDICVTHLRVR